MTGKGNKAILLIDDNEIDLEVNKKLLKKGTGAEEVEARESVKEGLAYLNEAANNGQYPELILLDIYMPGMDGFQFLEHFQEYPKAMVQHCSILMLSSSRDELDLNRAQAHPLITAVLKKPLDVSEVAGYLS